MPIAEPIPMPPTVDEHPSVQRHVRQFAELQNKLKGAQVHRADLVTQRDQLRRERHEMDVSVLLGDRRAAGDASGERLVQLDAEIARAVADERAITDALELFEIIAKGVREQVEVEVEKQVEMAALAVVQQMVPLAAELDQLNRQLLTLAERAPGLVGPLPGLFKMWHAQMRVILGDR